MYFYVCLHEIEEHISLFHDKNEDMIQMKMTKLLNESIYNCGSYLLIKLQLKKNGTYHFIRKVWSWEKYKLLLKHNELTSNNG